MSSDQKPCRICKKIGSLAKKGKGRFRTECRKCRNKKRELQRKKSEINKKTKADYQRRLRKRPDMKKKLHAYSKVQAALRSGEIKKAPCEKCGNKKVEGHHDDYSKPLDIRWLCVMHHKMEHAQCI